MTEISPEELQARRASEAPPQIIDVREDWELQISRLPDVLHIPMGQIPARLHEIDRGRPVVVICRSGGRSRQVAEFLDGQGFKEVGNLTGGILAWGQRIDPSLHPY